MNAVNVMLVDDQELVRACIRSRIETDPDLRVVAEADCGESARLVMQGRQVDVVLMDVSMPGIGGLETTRRLLNANPRVKILGLSMYTNGPMPTRLLEAGAAGYLSKQARPDEMVQAIKRVHRGRAYISHDVAQDIAANYDQQGRHRGLEELTDRELQILLLLSRGDDADEIAQQINRSLKTVHSHRRSLLRKLGARNDVQLAIIAAQSGLLDGSLGSALGGGAMN